MNIDCVFANGPSRLNEPFKWAALHRIKIVAKVSNSAIGGNTSRVRDGVESSGVRDACKKIEYSYSLIFSP